MPDALGNWAPTQARDGQYKGGTAPIVPYTLLDKEGVATFRHDLDFDDLTTLVVVYVTVATAPYESDDSLEGQALSLTLWWGTSHEEAHSVVEEDAEGRTYFDHFTMPVARCRAMRRVAINWTQGGWGAPYAGEVEVID